MWNAFIMYDWLLLSIQILVLNVKIVFWITFVLILHGNLDEKLITVMARVRKMVADRVYEPTKYTFYIKASRRR